jgi:hypothetical protein
VVVKGYISPTQVIRHNKDDVWRSGLCSCGDCEYQHGTESQYFIKHQWFPFVLISGFRGRFSPQIVHGIRAYFDYNTNSPAI